MKRRQLLQLSGLTLSVSLGGCASIGDIEEDSEFTVTRTGEIPVENRTSEFARSYPGQEPFAEVVFGERPKTSDNLHGVEIYNDYENPVEVSLTVNREEDERTLVFEGEGTISIDEYMVIAISPPATYINNLEVSGDDVNLQKTFDVPQSAWDAEPKDDKGISPEHNVHIKQNEVNVRFVGEER
ncbi:hypothetical protein HWV23_10725 [Natronomonas halophila]|uniref:hypothetical protein n=1 Tax=Natronomonas halophila TaxID=2747817 RepID=UPI0015B78243|nr:hypothetical protein [Natronomonas halophila]QLD86177.1 hypothetical protein HWV23_10725 [Natronomonas halophila]